MSYCELLRFRSVCLVPVYAFADVSIHRLSSPPPPPPPHPPPLLPISPPIHFKQDAVTRNVNSQIRFAFRLLHDKAFQVALPSQKWPQRLGRRRRRRRRRDPELLNQFLLKSHNKIWGAPLHTLTETVTLTACAGWWLKCCFTSAETVGLLGTGAQDGHLDFHTAPELWCLCWRGREPVSPNKTDAAVSQLVECCFTSTETVGLLGTGAQDGRLDFHTAPELCREPVSPDKTDAAVSQSVQTRLMRPWASQSRQDWCSHDPVSPDKTDTAVSQSVQTRLMRPWASQSRQDWCGREPVSPDKTDAAVSQSVQARLIRPWASWLSVALRPQKP